MRATPLPLTWTTLLLAAALLLGAPRAACADEDEAPNEVPVEVRAELDEADALTLGRWRLKLTYVPLEDIHRPYRIELRLTGRSRTLLELDHAPDPPTPHWRKGEEVTYVVDVPVPLESGLAPGTPLDLTLGFFDPAIEKIVPPRTEKSLWGNRLPLARLEIPKPPEADDPAHVEAVVERARAIAKEGRKADAWRALEHTLRQAKKDGTKRHLRDVILALAPYDEVPVSVLEQDIVRQRIAEERRRYLRLMSSRHYRQGKLFAALRLLEEVGGTLEEDAEGAVIGALADAERTEKDIQEIQLRILGNVSDEDKAKAQAAVQKLGATRKLIDKALSWAKEEAYGKARIALRHVSLGNDRDLASEARDYLNAVEQDWLNATPPDEAELVEQAKNHPAFDRLATSTSQRFIYIGPKTLVDGIPKRSRLRYDLAYVFQTDLFGRMPNPSGDRITVFFKELWDFGGGQAGHKRIDIGKADPHRKGYRVDTGLLYHELTHCIDDTSPIQMGFREGLADFGAAYTFESLGQRENELHAMRRALEAFRKDYLERDIAFWRIQNYGPSAGFFLHFVDAYARTRGGHDWSTYRRFFRDYRRSVVKDARDPYLIRAFAHFLVQSFGSKAFDDLVRFRFPLKESDRDIIAREIEIFERGEHRVPYFADDFENHPSSPLPRDLGMRELLEEKNGGTDAGSVRAQAREMLGILHDWWVIGPFKSKGADPRAHVFPPEREIDLAKEYVNGLNTCKWRQTAPEGVVSVTATGWVSFNFSYMDDTATYALCHVTVDEAQTAHVHVRADDDLALFVNDRRIEDYVARGQGGASFVWWRGFPAAAPDAQRFVVPLRVGRNKVLLKVKNRHGKSGFVFAVSKPDGKPIPGLTTDLDAAEPPAKTKRIQWKDAIRHAFRTKSFAGKIEPAVGTLKVVNRRLVGQAKDKGVPWRKYTVRPGFPKDSPSNLFWLKAKHTEELSDFRLKLDLAPPEGKAPKLVVTFQGEGGKDVLAGWALIIHPQGKKQVRARLERHELLVYQTAGVEVKPDKEGVLELVLTLVDDRLDVTLGGAVLLEGASVRRVPERHRIGVATWGPGLGIVAFELERPQPR